jgi:phosphoribosylformylglycinamidine cyclo-ligase
LRDRIGTGEDLLGKMGGFGAAIELPVGYQRPVLVSATDGVGTKTEIARRMGRLDTIGRDLVAMCADDVVCHGAKPLFLLDYLAVGRVDAAAVAEIVAGVAAGCAEAGCELVGGETAEHPGVMAPDQFDLAGFCVGIVERDRLLDGSAARMGDAILGLASSGLHANGYSLVRVTLERRGIPLEAPLPAGGTSFGEALLEPTRIYALDVLAVLDALGDHHLRVGGVAHITGGGLPGNLPRAVGPELGVQVLPDIWPVPRVVSELGELAGLEGAELRRTFNAGIGMAVVVEPAAVEPALAVLSERGVAAWVIGEVVGIEATGASRYVEAG